MDGESTTRDHPDFAPMVVGHTESDHARVSCAHDENREELAPGLRQGARGAVTVSGAGREALSGKTTVRIPPPAPQLSGADATGAEATVTAPLDR
mgnify:CR=1 FL=1